MRRRVLLISGLVMAISAVNAQNLNVNTRPSKELVTKHEFLSSPGSTQAPLINNNASRAVLWQDDFSNPSTWTMTNTSAPISWDWVITNDQTDIPNAAPSLQPFQSTTASNGFALINSDGQPNNADGNGAIVANMTNVTPIDLTGSPNVILTFQHSYRWWHENRGVRVSGDNGATWTAFPITSDTGGDIPTGYPNNQNSENPVTEMINISAVAGGQSQVLIQFYYNDNNIWAWYWVVDDVKILDQPADDIQLLSGWFVGANNGGVEYGRTPAFHLDANYVAGAEVYNFGINNQTNVDFEADFTSFTVTASTALIESDSTAYIEQTSSPTLAIGTYNGTYHVESDQETGGAEFSNNTYLRNFEITDEMYSQDGIGIHPAGLLDVGSIGTGSFADSEDGLTLAAMYHIRATDDVVSITVMLDAANTVAGGVLDASIKDTASFLAGDMTGLYTVSSIPVTATDVTNGYITVNFPAGTTLNPGAYYAAVELYSNAGANDIFVLDDRTITQPFWASAINIPSDQSYTNGEAFAIRLRMAGGDASIGENTLANVSVYPNPATDFVNVKFDIEEYHNVKVQLINNSGQVIYTSNLASAYNRVDLQNVAAGIYFVKLTADEGTMVQKIIVSK